MGFGVKHIIKETPAWATWMFRIVFLLTTVTTIIIAGEPTIDDELKVRIGVYLKGFEALIFGLSKMFGVDVNEDITSEESNGESTDSGQPPN